MSAKTTADIGEKRAQRAPGFRCAHHVSSRASCSDAAVACASWSDFWDADHAVDAMKELAEDLVATARTWDSKYLGRTAITLLGLASQAALALSETPGFVWVKPEGSFEEPTVPENQS